MTLPAKDPSITKGLKNVLPCSLTQVDFLAWKVIFKDYLTNGQRSRYFIL